MGFPVSGTISKAANILAKRPAVLVPLLLSWLVSIPFIIYISSPPDLTAYSFGTATGWLATMFGAALVIGLLSIFFEGFAISVAYNSISRNPSLRESAGTAVSTYLYLLAATIIMIIALTAGLIALIIPGIFIALKLSLAPYAVVVDRLGPIEAMEKSWKITKNNLLSIFLLGIVIFLPAFAISFIIGIMAGVSPLAGAPQAANAYADILSSLIATFFAGLYTVSMALVYKKLR